MSILERDNNESKIKLIYEFNPESPLFTRVAASLLRNGNIVESIEILDKGIKQYSDYPTAFLILAICKAYAGEIEEAKKYVSKCAEMIDSEETLDYYLSKIEEINKERNSLSEAIRPAIISTENENKKESIEERLETLSQMLTGAKINYKSDDSDNIVTEIKGFTGKKIVSETLANIYVSQKNFKEAIAIYKELIKKNPEKTDEYEKKITEISQIIDTGLV